MVDAISFEDARLQEVLALLEEAEPKVISVRLLDGSSSKAWVRKPWKKEDNNF